MDQARENLERLIQERGVNYSSLSRLLGRNAAYIQQYIKRNSPRHLDENDRMVLARFFGVDERVLGAPARRSGPVIELVQVPILDVDASATVDPSATDSFPRPPSRKLCRRPRTRRPPSSLCRSS